jgi:membrane protein implicated in regulation of membrane protease activity
MSFHASTLWWVATGLLVAVELGTGTFYLLMLALGAAAGAISAHLGMPLAQQLVVGAVVGLGTTALWHWKRSQQPAATPTQNNRDVQIDIGQRVKVDSWGSDHLSRTQYRGASWQVRFVGSGAVAPGHFVITGVDGNVLLVQPAADD